MDRQSLSLLTRIRKRALDAFWSSFKKAPKAPIPRRRLQQHHRRQPMADDSHTSDKTTAITAGAAGAGSGPLLVLLANNLPDNSGLKSWLIIVAPSASIAAAYLWNKASVAVENYLRKRELRGLIVQAQETLKHALGNGQTSQEHRAKLSQELEQLELLLIQTDVEKIKSLRSYR